MVLNAVAVQASNNLAKRSVASRKRSAGLTARDRGVMQSSFMPSSSRCWSNGLLTSIPRVVIDFPKSRVERFASSARHTGCDRGFNQTQGASSADFPYRRATAFNEFNVCAEEASNQPAEIELHPKPTVCCRDFLLARRASEENSGVPSLARRASVDSDKSTNRHFRSLSGHDELMIGRTDREHRAGSFSNDPFSDAAQQDVRQPRSAMRAHHNQIDVGFFGVANDFEKRRSLAGRADDCLAVFPSRVEQLR